MPQVEIGKIFEDKFLILSQLGKGGMGQVFLAKHLEQDRLVALKMLLPKYDQDTESVARFFREFKLLSTLRHKGIVLVFALSTDSTGNPFAICEYIEGKDLKKILSESGPLPWEETLSIVCQIAESLSYVHGHGVVHHDIKPDNIIIITESGESTAKLLDFGLSRLADSSEEGKLTWTGQLLGSPVYMAPEQLHNRGDVRSDIYSLGCVTFELLTGHAMFDADTPLGVLWRKSDKGELNSIFSGLQVKVPRSLYIALLKMLETDPSKRFQSMKEVLETLQQIESEPGPLRAVREWTQESKRPGTYSRQQSLIAGIALMLILGILLFIQNQHRHEKPGVSITSLESAAERYKRSGNAEKAAQIYLQMIAMLRKEPTRMQASYKRFYTASRYLQSYYHAHPSAKLAAEVLACVDDFCKMSIQRNDDRLYSECVGEELSMVQDRVDAKTLVMARIQQSIKAWGATSPSTLDIVSESILVFLNKKDFSTAREIANTLAFAESKLNEKSFPYLKRQCALSLLEAETGNTKESLIYAKEVFDSFESEENFLSLHQKIRLLATFLEPAMEKIGREDLYIKNATSLLEKKQAIFETDPALAIELCSSLSRAHQSRGNSKRAQEFSKLQADYTRKARTVNTHWLPEIQSGR